MVTGWLVKVDFTRLLLQPYDLLVDIIFKVLGTDSLRRTRNDMLAFGIKKKRCKKFLAKNLLVSCFLWQCMFLLAYGLPFLLLVYRLSFLQVEKIRQWMISEQEQNAPHQKHFLGPSTPYESFLGPKKKNKSRGKKGKGMWAVDRIWERSLSVCRTLYRWLHNWS